MPTDAEPATAAKSAGATRRARSGWGVISPITYRRSAPDALAASAFYPSGLAGELRRRVVDRPFVIDQQIAAMLRQTMPKVFFGFHYSGDTDILDPMARSAARLWSLCRRRGSCCRRSRP